MLVMCADHGVWDEGGAVSPKNRDGDSGGEYDAGNNRRMCVFAARVGAKVHVIDVGIDAEPIPAEGYASARL
ncbi:nicotinate-nucleotide--dimethylbenzimidazole phosphoribosyltransferase [Salmonella enterica subsp. enterica]|nr:nicotinate-nucleotide--dimethylbenzimidazole phosphoribosyltransferase [Salmonella enterica subsp. enterica]